MQIIHTADQATEQGQLAADKKYRSPTKGFVPVSVPMHINPVAKRIAANAKTPTRLWGRFPRIAEIEKKEDIHINDFKK